VAETTVKSVRKRNTAPAKPMNAAMVKFIKVVVLGVLALAILLILTFSGSCYFYVGKQKVGPVQQPLIGAGSPEKQSPAKAFPLVPPKPEVYYIIPVEGVR
jgi:hypothetical protein